MSERFRWRKISDIGRMYALFELLQEDVPILDVGYSDEGTLELAFDPSIAGSQIAFDEFLNLLELGRQMADRDR